MSHPASSHLPRSWRRPDKPDRIMAAYRRLIPGYAALTGRSRRTDPDASDRTLRMIVARKKTEATDVVSLRLEPVDARILLAWHPGAHLDLVLPSGRIRQYSLCGDPVDRCGYEIAVRRIPDGGGGSAEIHDDLTEGATVSVREPRNAFPFAHPALALANISNVVFVAGGIGITPILPMVRAAATTGVNWHLTYFGRRPESLPFLDQLTTFDERRIRILTSATTGRPDAETLLSHARAGSAIYYCGPPSLISAVHEVFATTGAAGLHYERFAPPPVTGGRPFDVHLARTGDTLPIPADRTALAVAREKVPGVAYSCQQGFCGTCRVRVLRGHIERRGQSPFLADPDTMLLCSDRASDAGITIDL